MRTIPFGKPMLDEKEKKAVINVLNGTTLTHGPLVKEFEKMFALFTGAEYAVAVSSCTAGLHLYYFHVGIGPGDEVIVPVETHVATAHAVELCGGKPVFVDSENITGNIDLDQVEKKITEKTKAISVVHYLGMPVDMKKVMEIASKYGLPVIEDCALAIGTKLNGKHAGLWGDVGCFSFYPVKHITTAEGGMIITRSKKIADSISKLRAFGIDRNIVSERKIPGIYDVQELGFNYRMNEISAAIGIEQMKKVEDFLEIRKRNYMTLHNELRNIEEIELFKTTYDDYKSSYYCMAVILKEPLCRKRFEIMEVLAQKGIGVSIYYPKPVPLMSYYKNKYGYKENDFPVAFRLSDFSIALPVAPHLDQEDMIYIAATLKEIIIKLR